jgi:hypothetical protein
MGLSHIIQSRLHMFTNVRDIIFDICRQESNMVAGKFATLLWFVWHNGNNKVWNDSSLQAQQIGAQAAKHWHDWAAVHDLQIDAQQPVHTATAAAITTQWQQPPRGYLKCNVDASFYNLAGSSGWGWVVRDSSGDFKVAGSNIINTPLSVLEGEAMALVEAMEEMIHRGLSHVFEALWWMLFPPIIRVFLSLVC